MSFSRSIALIESDIAAGRSLGAQLFVAREGRTLIDEAFGEAAPGMALTADAMLPWMSCTKPIVAIAVAQQWEDGRLNLDEPVATYLPAFAQHGKQAVTIRHLLTHTGGFRPVVYHFPDDGWDTIVEKICAAPLEPGWRVGATAGYHMATSWYILGELVQRMAGESLPGYVRRRIFEPLGMTDCYIGMPPQVYDRLADRVTPIWDTRRSEPRQQVYAKRDRVTACSPGAGAVGPANQLGAFYRALLAGGEPIVSRETVEMFTARHREGLHDVTFGQTIDWGLGFIIDSKRYGKLVIPYGFGAYASDEAFGHGGNQSSLAFADPPHRLVVTFIFNGMPGEIVHQQRSHELATVVYEDLGLTVPG